MRNFFKTLVKLSWIAVAILVVFTGCKKDDDDDDNGNPSGLQNGYYITGEGTALTELDSKGKMVIARNEVNQAARSQLLEIYLAVEGGTDGFNIVMVSGETQTTFGPGDDFDVVAEENRIADEPKVDFWRGSYTETEEKFTVPTDGLYHIIIDTELEIAVIAPVQWGIIGSATPAGWSNSTPLPQGAFDLNMLTFEAPEVALIAGEYKFRYSDGWKIVVDDAISSGGVTGVRVNTNYGGALNALVPGGSNIAHDEPGIYKITMTWSLEDGTSADVVFVREGDPTPEYPEELYMIGSALDTADTDDNGTPDGWQWELTDMPMIPVHSHPELFWRIVWLYEGQALKFAPGQEWVGDFGKSGDATDGVFAKGSQDVPVPAAGSGYYMVVVDLENETIEVNPAKVYGIGDAFGGYDTGVEANLFTVDNENMVIKFTDVPADGDLRMYAAATTLAADWWQAEFIILEGNIVYRGTGNDQERVAVTTGQDVTLNFMEGTGAIE